MSDPKPCPFCGKAGIIYSPISYKNWEYGCCSDEECQLHKNHLDVEFNLKQWNSRPIEDTLQAEIDRLASWGKLLLKLKAQHQDYLEHDRITINEITKALKEGKS